MQLNSSLQFLLFATICLVSCNERPFRSVLSDVAVLITAGDAQRRGNGRPFQLTKNLLNEMDMGVVTVFGKEYFLLASSLYHFVYFYVKGLHEDLLG